MVKSVQVAPIRPERRHRADGAFRISKYRNVRIIEERASGSDSIAAHERCYHGLSAGSREVGDRPCSLFGIGHSLRRKQDDRRVYAVVPADRLQCTGIACGASVPENIDGIGSP